MAGPVLFLKAHVSAYRRQDGTPVVAHERGGQAKPVVKVGWPFRAGERALAAPAQKVVAAAEKPVSAFQQKYGMGKPVSHAQYSGHQAKLIAPQYALKPGAQAEFFSKPFEEPKAWHPRANDKGEKVGIHNPHTPSSAAAWQDPESTGTVIAGGAAPAELHGVAFAPWTDAPTSIDGWEDVPGQAEIDEPEFDCPEHLDAAAGVLIQEPDGRVWLVSPTNGYGGYRNTFPKGRADDGLSLQATAIKEAFEESGLQVEITGHLGDFARTQTYTRYYFARRVGGTPAAMGWESQAVRLAPLAALHLLLNGGADQPVRDALTA